MSEDFRGPDLKANRADTHISELNDLLSRFMKAQTYRVFADLDLEPGTISWVARGNQPFRHDEFAPLIGDAIHNMRDSLDLAVSALVRLKTGSDKHVEFLTRENRAEFETALKERAKKQSWPTNLVHVLRDVIEPYMGGHGYQLRLLHNLAVMDKHRLIIPTVFGTSVVYFGVDGNHVPMHIGKPAPMTNGGVVATTPLAQAPNIKVDHEAMITVTVAFDSGCGILEGRRVMDGLIGMLNATKETLENLRECLPR